MRLVIPLATSGVVLIVVTALAGDRPPRAAGTLGGRQIVLERGEPIIRPPASIPSSRGSPHAVASPNSTDRHVAEFLRWKDQHAPR
jgi:hypothetical protein